MLEILRIDSEDAAVLIRGAIAKAKDIGVPMCVAVVDEAGNLIAFERMDGGKITSITIAQDKAFTAAAARRATHELNKLCVPAQPMFGIHTEVGSRISVIGGGLPIVVNSFVVGGIGVSSGTPEQDLECAQAAVDELVAGMK
jgi:uncharacterized protein GlcG (DUF336 family)